MRVGAAFPQTEIGNDPAAIGNWACAVEDLGFDHILAFDHVLGVSAASREKADDITNEDPCHEVLVLLSYLAALTSRVELVAGVLILPERQAVLAAKQAAEVDVLSGGRLRLGVGLGWNTVEFQALGVPYAQRGARCEEQVHLLRALWDEPTVDFVGRWHRVDNAGINPRPVRGRIPVWFGGGVEGTVRRVARMGDGWFPQFSPNANARAMVERLHGYAREAGRDPASVGLEARLSVGRSAQERAHYAAGWRDLGASHLYLSTMGARLRTWSDHVDALRAMMRDIQPALR